MNFNNSTIRRLYFCGKYIIVDIESENVRREVKMDEKRFGSFIAKQRKEKGWTQAMLAEKICVTDKAISKWERGAGFPDIKTLEPLAAALDVTLSELMYGEKIDKIESIQKLDDVVSNTIDFAVYQSEIHMRNILIGIVVFAFLLVTIFLLDLENGPGVFFFICLPLLISLLGIAVVNIGIQRKKKMYKSKWYFIVGSILILFPLECYIFTWIMVLIVL